MESRKKVSSTKMQSASNSLMAKAVAKSFIFFSHFCCLLGMNNDKPSPDKCPARAPSFLGEKYKNFFRTVNLFPDSRVYMVGC